MTIIYHILGTAFGEAWGKLPPLATTKKPPSRSKNAQTWTKFVKKRNLQAKTRPAKSKTSLWSVWSLWSLWSLWYSWLRFSEEKRTHGKGHNFEFLRIWAGMAGPVAEWNPGCRNVGKGEDRHWPLKVATRILWLTVGGSNLYMFVYIPKLLTTIYQILNW